MRILQRLFAREPEALPLPPLNDPSLGELRWDADSEGWVGALTGPNGNIEVYLGSGTAQAYPSEQMRLLLREPYSRIHEFVASALAYLKASGKPEQWNVELTALVASGLESYEHYLDSGTYTLTFTASHSEAIWKVDFENGQPIGCGVDG